jgi:nicotinamidase-related amidase
MRTNMVAAGMAALIIGGLALSCAGSAGKAGNAEPSTGPGSSAPGSVPGKEADAGRKLQAKAKFINDEAPPPLLYSPAERKKLSGTALLVIDMQVGMMPVVAPDRIFPAILLLVDRAGKAGCPVAWGYMDEFGMGRGSPEFELAPPLELREGDLPFIKTSGNSFNGSGLVPIFDRAGIGTIVLCGMSSGGCVNDTVEGAKALGYRVIVPSDGHTVGGEGVESPAIDYMNRVWAREDGVQVLPASDIAFSRPSAPFKG